MAVRVIVDVEDKGGGQLAVSVGAAYVEPTGSTQCGDVLAILAALDHARGWLLTQAQFRPRPQIVVPRIGMNGGGR